MAGRPTKYSEEILKAAQKYLKTCVDKTIKKRGIVNLPTIQGLAVYLKVNQDTLFEWAKIYLEFSEALQEIKSEQAKRLINKGLTGEYNSTIAKLILSSNHGMFEKKDVTSDGKAIQGNTIIFADFNETDS